jgi:hypothetical protein
MIYTSSGFGSGSPTTRQRRASKTRRAAARQARPSRPRAVATLLGADDDAHALRPCERRDPHAPIVAGRPAGVKATRALGLP